MDANFLYSAISLIIGYLLGSLPTGGPTSRKQSRNLITDFLLFFINSLKGYLIVFAALYIFSSNNQNVSIITFLSFGAVLGQCCSLYYKVKKRRFDGSHETSVLFGILFALNFYNLFIPWGIIVLFSIIFSGRILTGQFVGAITLPLVGFFFLPEYQLLTILCAIPIVIKKWPKIASHFSGKKSRQRPRKRKVRKKRR